MNSSVFKEFFYKNRQKCDSLHVGVIALMLLYFSTQQVSAQEKSLRFARADEIVVGAAQLDRYLPWLTGKGVGVVCNHTSLVNDVHLVDTLLSEGIAVQKIFSPEHGFRGTAAEGEKTADTVDPSSGIPVISLYGNNRKPPPSSLQDIDIMVFDIQDVGARFYTYISTLALVMEACAGSSIPLVILDRPNPNGFYVDGPVLDTAFRSFVGMHPVPIAHGMTVAEYALMINGERWLETGIQCELKIVKAEGYDHSLIYRLPVRPSPNLPDWRSVYLYPSLCLFEGTIVSVGRGTDMPFQVIGHPDLVSGSYVFVPRATNNSSIKPAYEGQACHGQSLTGYAENILFNEPGLNLDFLINYYGYLSTDHAFFTNYFDQLAGNSQLRQQIIDNVDIQDIKKSWSVKLDEYRTIRMKYLLYPDFSH